MNDQFDKYSPDESWRSADLSAYSDMPSVKYRDRISKACKDLKSKTGWDSLSYKK